MCLMYSSGNSKDPKVVFLYCFLLPPCFSSSLSLHVKLKSLSVACPNSTSDMYLQLTTGMTGSECSL